MRAMMMLLSVALLWGCAPDSGTPGAPASQAPAAPGADAETAAGEPVVSEAWIRVVPPAARMTAGYLKIHNPGPADIVVVGAESPSFGSIEVHGTFMEDGVARMRHVERLEVPVGKTVSLEPGGLHLMLMQPVNGIPSSGAIAVALQLEDGRRLEFSAPVGQPAD